MIKESLAVQNFACRMGWIVDRGSKFASCAPVGTLADNGDLSMERGNLKNWMRVWIMNRVARASNCLTENGRQWTRMRGQSIEMIVEVLFYPQCGH